MGKTLEEPGFPATMWSRFRSLPIWLQILAALLILRVVVSLFAGQEQEGPPDITTASTPSLSPSESQSPQLTPTAAATPDAPILGPPRASDIEGIPVPSASGPDKYPNEFEGFFVMPVGITMQELAEWYEPKLPLGKGWGSDWDWCRGSPFGTNPDDHHDREWVQPDSREASGFSLLVMTIGEEDGRAYVNITSRLAGPCGNPG